MTPAEAKKVLETAMPKWQVVEQTADTDSAVFAKPDDHSAEVKTLRRKYLGSDADSAEHGAAADKTNGSVIVVATPKKMDALSSGHQAKAFVVTDGKVIGIQG